MGCLWQILERPWGVSGIFLGRPIGGPLADFRQPQRTPTTPRTCTLKCWSTFGTPQGSPTSIWGGKSMGMSMIDVQAMILFGVARLENSLFTVSLRARSFPQTCYRSSLHVCLTSDFTSFTALQFTSLQFISLCHASVIQRLRPCDPRRR